MTTEVIVKPQPIVLEGASEETGFDTANESLAAPGAKAPPEPVVVAEVEKPVPVVPPVVAPPPVEYVQLTKQEHAELKAMAGRVPGLASNLDKLLGTVGNAQQLAAQIVEKAQAATPTGITVEMSDELFAEMKENFPEMADMQRALLDKLFKAASVKGTGGVGPEAVQEAVAKAFADRDMQSLKKAYPNWQADAGQVAPGQAFAADHPFHVWLATQSPEYREAVTKTDSALDIKEALDSFHAAQKAAAVTTPTPTPTPGELRAAARRENIAATITPKGDARPPASAPQLSEEEAFNSV